MVANNCGSMLQMEDETQVKLVVISTGKNKIVKQYSETSLEGRLHWPQKCGLSRQVVFGDRSNFIQT